MNWLEYAAWSQSRMAIADIPNHAAFTDWEHALQLRFGQLATASGLPPQVIRTLIDHRIVKVTRHQWTRINGTHAKHGLNEQQWITAKWLVMWLCTPLRMIMYLAAAKRQGPMNIKDIERIPADVAQCVDRQTKALEELILGRREPVVTFDPSAFFVDL
jgi:hypothetical protein